MKMNENTTRGLVIKCSDYGESDKIVTFISRDLGKIRGIAKGARRSLKRFGGCLEQFSLVDMVVRPRDGLSLLLEGKVIRNYKKIKADIDKIFYGTYLLDLTNSLVGDGHDDNMKDIFHLLLSALETLEECEYDEGCLREYEVRILSKVGYMPSFLNCISCGKEVEPYRNRISTMDMNIGFSSSKGGVFCELCEKRVDDRLEFISFGTLKTLEAATHKKVSFTRHALLESGKIIPPFISHRLGKRLKSLDFLERVKGI
ncbi:MAG: DNA repair protein RecO [Proteobacteria bacterium]|nr:DNA repair protein RecO [Pseudomonadota bacterium]